MSPASLQERLVRLLPVGSLRERFFKGTFWSVLGTAAFQGLLLCGFVGAAQILGSATSFGQLGMIYSTVGMFGVFAGMGLATTAAKHIGQFRLSDPPRAGRVAGLSLTAALASGGITSLIMFGLSPLVAGKLISAPHLSDDLRLACGLLLFNTLYGAQAGVLTGLEAFRLLAVGNCMRGLLSLVLILLGVRFAGLRGAVTGLVAGAACGVLLNAGLLRIACKQSGVSLSFRSAGEERSVLWRFSVPALLAGSLAGPVFWASRAILVNLRRDGYAELGILSAAQRMMVAITMLPMMMSQVALPILSGLYERREITRYRQALWKLAGLTGACAAMIGVAICLVSPLLMSMYGKEFEAGWRVLCVLSAATVVSAVNMMVGLAIASSGRMWWAFIFNGLWGLTVLIGSAALSGPLGSLGVANAILIAYCLHSLWQGGYVYFKIVREPARPSRAEELPPAGAKQAKEQTGALT